MKLIRFITEDDRLLYGSYTPDQPEHANIILGDPLKGPNETNEKVRIKRLLAPIVPCNIFALGLNYRRHADETNMPHPKIPIIFSKATTSVVGHQEHIVLPKAGHERVDYEGELAVIIGREGKNIESEDAMDYVFGYTCANDVSARDWQLEKQQGQWFRGKSFDTFCPLGPFIVTRDDIAEPNNLALKTQVNGRTVQDSRTSDMIFNIPSMISFLSRSMTLLPGTVILTGTPEGVGFSRQPPLFLSTGDIVHVEIEKIGVLENAVIMENQ